MKKNNNKKASIVVLSLILVGFLLVLSVGVIKIILTESNDTYAMKNSLKAFYGAESSLELALLKIKIKGFGYEMKLNKEKKGESAIFVKDLNNFKRNSDILLSYDIKSKSQSASGTIKAGDSDIYQLFYLTGSTDFSDQVFENKATNIELKISDGNAYNITWSIISRTDSISGTGGINSSSQGVGKKMEHNKPTFFSTGVTDFLSNHSGSFLIIGNFNNNNNNNINYKLTTTDSNDYFTGKYTTILASAKVGKNKQNIELKIDNSKYLNIIKNIIYSK